MMMLYGCWFCLIFLIIILYLVFSFSNEKKEEQDKGKKPIDLLNERFARGEISDEEYLKIKHILQEKE